MSWDMEQAKAEARAAVSAKKGSVSVVVKQNGETHSNDFKGDDTVKHAMDKMSDKYNMPSFVLEDNKRREIFMSEGNKLLSEFEGPLVMFQRGEGSQ